MLMQILEPRRVLTVSETELFIIDIMRLTTPTVLLITFAIACATAQTAMAAATVETPHTSAALIAENLGFTPGTDNWVGLQLSPRPGWHTYWRNPGDAGLPTRLQWTLPADVHAGAIVWPAPSRIMFGGLVNYGYDAPTLHLVPLHVPAAWPAGKPLTLKTHASWLICKDICIPESADLTLQLPTHSGPAQPDPSHAAAFAAARADIPRPPPASWQVRYAIHDGSFSLGLHGSGVAGKSATFFPYAQNLINYSSPQRLAHGDDGLRLSTDLSDHYQPTTTQVHGVLELTTGDGHMQAYAVDVPPGAVVAVPKSVQTQSAIPAASQAPTKGLALVLLFALLGGLILNLMPCVFPVLSIKVLTLIKSRGLAHSAQRRHGYAYTLGVVLSTVLAASLLLALRAGGEALGWGFQLQSPPFVAVLAYVMFALGLSMSGVIGFGGRLMGVGQSLTTSSGYASSFFTGVLAVVVASPCSAPFMGAALGYALIQPAITALLIFAALGLGLALPFLLIGLFPRLGAWLPRPGPWMETFKQLMAFPLYLTAIWLVWVLARQQGADAAALALVGMLLLALGLWARGRWPQARSALTLLLVCVVGAGLLLAQPALTRARTNSTTPTTQLADGIQPYSAARLATLRKQGRTVFVDFTADWCVTCKVNEHVTLASDAVHQAFQRQDVAWLQGDWTRSDPAITRVLTAFGRPGVPLYLVYPQGGTAVVLPQVLTPQTVINAVSPKIAGGDA